MDPFCKICNAPAIKHGEATLRQKFHARYLKCVECGFISVEDPNWLAEAYTEPINRSDTGYVWRNLWCRDKVCSLIEASRLNGDGVFLDYAAGYGMFVRLMRDCGYDFRWLDPYCQNLFSRGFEAPVPLAGEFEAVTAFEVLEHLPDPLQEIKKIVALTPVFVFSTTLLPEPAPQPGNWWYYGLEHGQHVAFYTRKSLEFLANQFGCRLTTNDTDFHVISRKEISFEAPAGEHVPRWKFWRQRPQLSAKPKRESLMMRDHDTIAKQMLENGSTELNSKSCLEKKGEE